MNKLIIQQSLIKRYNKWLSDIQSCYRPYLNVRAVNKVGRRHWLWCDIQKREVHLLSDGERRAYGILVSFPDVVSVMEQYALDVTETIEIAEKLGFIHPRIYTDNTVTVMTTDFVVINAGVELNGDKFNKVVAYTFKYHDEIYTNDSCTVLSNSASRTTQKLKIEQEYWRRRGIEYRVITEKHASKYHHWNIQFCRNGVQNNIDKTLLMKFSDDFHATWLINRCANLDDLLHISAKKMAIDSAMALQFFKLSVLHSYLNLAHAACIQLYRPIELR